jgi:hypothetical protein
MISEKEKKNKRKKMDARINAPVTWTYCLQRMRFALCRSRGFSLHAEQRIALSLFLTRPRAAIAQKHKEHDPQKKRHTQGDGRTYKRTCHVGVFPATQAFGFLPLARSLSTRRAARANGWKGTRKKNSQLQKETREDT